MTVETEGGRVRAGAAVLAINAATRGFKPLRARISVTSSHIVLTEPVPDVLEALGWTGGECITDARTFVHYFRTTRDGRIVFGWGGGRLAPGARLDGRVEVDPEVAGETAPPPGRDVPGAGGPRDHPRLGRPDRRLPEPPARRWGRSTARPCTTPSASPATASARRTWPAACSRRWPPASPTDLAVVDPEPVRVPPEPIAFAGGMLVRRAFLRKERLEDAGRRVDPLTRAVTAAPRALGIHVAR